MDPASNPKTSVNSPVTATAATLTSALDTSQPAGRARYKLLSNTAAWWAQGIADTVFTAVAATDVCTAVGHKLTTGDPVQVSTTTTLPGGLSAATTYWAIVLSADTFKLATSRANAVASSPTAIDITSAGTGTHTMTTVAVAAGAGSAPLAAGVPEIVDGCNGAKISIVRDAVDGRAAITQLLV